MGASGRPWHLWIVAVAFFALYVGGSRDYLLILGQDTDYIVRQFGPSGIAYFADYPLALRIIWTITIIGGLTTPFLLVALSRWSTLIAVITAVAQIVLMIATFALRDRWNALGAMTAWFDIGIAAIDVFVAWYCWMMQRRGALR